ncbi:hypothetical protein BOTBODRAFT_183075 [Botryobasidium botryosum FD-172 SS1]|uniref:DRBM domain-containing protein n=1 Tax=Botryobasidium botryosum (strain FD-172 SS1) TaxID=930990 RepID=A0A067NCN4_BOTB1|nr:hypothetical protein BOTBODRAFT_183075 [Botryobasidium botryosum FD-172 SS1]
MSSEISVADYVVGNYVMKLHNHYQALAKADLIVYEETCEGPSHDANWTVTVRVEGVAAQATSRKIKWARDMAARQVMTALNILPEGENP